MNSPLSSQVLCHSRPLPLPIYPLTSDTLWSENPLDTAWIPPDSHLDTTWTLLEHCQDTPWPLPPHGVMPLDTIPYVVRFLICRLSPVKLGMLTEKQELFDENCFEKVTKVVDSCSLSGSICPWISVASCFNGVEGSERARQ